MGKLAIFGNTYLCNLKQQLMFQHWHLANRYAAGCNIRVQGGSAADVATPCSSSLATRHPVLLLKRWDTTNSFHTLEEVVTALVTLAAAPEEAGFKERGIQVVIADTSTPGYYMEVRRIAQVLIDRPKGSWLFMFQDAIKLAHPLYGVCPNATTHLKI